MIKQSGFRVCLGLRAAFGRETRVEPFQWAGSSLYRVRASEWVVQYSRAEAFGRSDRLSSRRIDTLSQYTRLCGSFQNCSVPRYAIFIYPSRICLCSRLTLALVEDAYRRRVHPALLTFFPSLSHQNHQRFLCAVQSL